MSHEDLHWKLRVVHATRGNTTEMGAIVLAIIGHKPNRLPYYDGLAKIDRFGVIWCKLCPRAPLLPAVVPVCRVEDWMDELRRLADKCKMDDREVHEFFDEARKWIERDERAKSHLH